MGNAFDFTRLGAAPERLPTLAFTARRSARGRYFACATESRNVTLTGKVRSIGHCVP